MPSYGELRPGTYYLIQEESESDIELVSVIVQTKKTVLLRRFLPTTEDFLRYSAFSVYKLIEELDRATALKFENLYGDTVPENEEIFVYEDDDEE